MPTSAKNKTRLMLITHDLSLGGLQQVVINICRTIDKDTFEPSVLCLRDIGEFSEEVTKLGIKVYMLPLPKNGIDYFAFFKVAKLLKKEKIDVIHTHNTQPFIDGIMGGILAGVKTMVHTEHGRIFPDKRRYMFADWLLSKFVCKVVAVSADMAHKLQKYEKISQKKITVIPNGIYGQPFTISIDTENKRQELGIDAGSRIIGVCARLCFEKGITYLLKAMPIILNSYPDSILLIAGNGPLEEQLKAETNKLNIDKHVKFLGLRKDIPELLKIFDVYVLSSISEGLPMGLLEAMAAGCPVIATSVGDIPEVIKTNETGILIKPESHDDIANAVVNLFGNSSLRNKIIINAQKVFNEQFEAAIMTKQYEKLYRQ